MRILVVGGDKRQEYLCEHLVKSGAECVHLKVDDEKSVLDSIQDYSVVMLPVPMTMDGKTIYSVNSELKLSVKSMLDILSEGQAVIGGRIEEENIRVLKSKEVKYIDLLKDDAFVTFNAYLTAQGALRLLLENTQSLIVNKKALVTGFGKVSKAMCSILHNNGVYVSVCARNSKDLLVADCMGYNTMTFEQLEKKISGYDYIFSTVPAYVIKERHIKSIKKESFKLFYTTYK